MDADEREVYFYLKGRLEEFVSANTICRHAGGKHRFRESPDWAKPVIRRMQERGILEVDDAGEYRLTPRPKSNVQRRWVSPHIAAILKRSGGKFDSMMKEEDEADAYYNSL